MMPEREQIFGIPRYALTLAAVLVLAGRSAWPQHPSNVWSVAWSPDGKRLATAGGSDPGTAKVWDAKTGKELLALSLRSAISNVSWSPDSKRLAAPSQDDTVTVWEAETGKELLTLGVHRNGAYADAVSSVAWSPDGKRLATGTGRLPPSRAEIETLRAHGLSVNLEKNPFDVLKVWDAETGKELLALNGRDKLISSVAWSPDGRRLAGSSNGTAKVWDARTGKELLTLSGNSNSVSSVAWSPDGKRLATWSSDNTAKVWDAQSGKQLRTLDVHSNGAYAGSVSSVAWSPDGRRLATASYEGKARLWDAETGQELLTLTSHSGRVFSVAWCPDGKRLATGSDCATVKVWDTDTGKELLKLEGFPGCEEMSESGGPRVTLGIEINLPAGGPWPVAVGEDHAVFYIPAVGAGEVLGVIAVSNAHFAGIRITPNMGEDSVKVAVSALVKAKKTLSDATCNEIRSWQSVDAGSYEGKMDESFSLTRLGQLGLPVFHVKVVGAGRHGPPPGGFHHPYAGASAHCDCRATRDALNDSIGYLAYPSAGECAEVGKCAQCCRITAP